MSRPVSMKFGSTQSKFRHMYGTESVGAERTYTNLEPCLSSSSDSPLIECNDAYWAIPYKGGGGPVYVSRHDNFGKVLPSCNLINGHKSSVLDIGFSHFHSDLMATSSGDTKVKIWKLPSLDTNEPIPTMGENDSLLTIVAHRHVVRLVKFSPVVDGLLWTSSLDMTVRLHNVETGDEISCLDLNLRETSQANAMSFNFDGSMIALSCKDRAIRICDPRSNSVVISTNMEKNNIGRNIRATWCSKSQSNDTIFACSSSSTGQRVVQLWDPRKLDEPTCSQIVDNMAGQLFPIYDEGIGVCFVAGKGDKIMRYYDVTLLDKEIENNTIDNDKDLGVFNNLSLADKKPSFVKASEFTTKDQPFSGFCILPKQLCDVKNVETTRILKLSQDSVTPISFTVPRAEQLKEFFQDDIFIPTRRRSSLIKIQQWIDSNPEENFEPEFECLSPPGMMKLSDKPPEEVVKTKVEGFKDAISKAQEENQIKEEKFAKLQELALQRAIYHPNASGGAKGHGFKVDAALVDEDSDENDWDD